MGAADLIGFAIFRLNEEAANNKGCGALFVQLSNKAGIT